MGFVGERNSVAGSYEVPNIDINYGLGHRVQLKYEVPLGIQEMRGDSGHVAAGLGNSLLGLKYRFYAHPKTKARDAAGQREATFGLPVRDAFRAAGYSPQEAQEFAAIVQSRIAELDML